MSRPELLGRVTRLIVRRFTPQGVYLGRAEDAGEEAPTVLLPRREVAEDVRVGAELEVFLYLDSEDRPVATTKQPRLEVGQVAFLTVKEVTPIGAFLDWGLAKDLLLPFGEQVQDLEVGDELAVSLTVDNTGRLAATMRVAELLKDRPPFALGEWVPGEAWRREPGVGVFVILGKEYVGLLPPEEAFNVRRGQARRYRVARIRADGKCDLSLRHERPDQLAQDAQRVLAYLREAGARPLGDSTPPEEIREVLGVSKKAFKRAAGHLLRQGQVVLEQDGFFRVKEPAGTRAGR